MCGRFNIMLDPEGLLDAFEVLARYRALDPFVPRYNIAPSEPPIPDDSQRKSPRRLTRIPIVHERDGRRVASSVVWPLIPHWADGEVPRYSTANARAETMRDKNAFRAAWSSGRRCLIPATGFYEWQAVDGQRSRQPWCIEPMNDDWFCFGGLWDLSRAPDGSAVLSATIITVAANPLMREIHNAGNNRHRMPLILEGDARGKWLSGSADDALDVVEPLPADEMHAYPIDVRINNPNRDEADVLAPLAV